MELYTDKLTVIANIPPDYLLITDSQDVKAVLEHIGKPELYGAGYGEGYNALFVKQENGDYIGVYAFQGIVPYLSKLARKVL